jgi:hypothetical protein
LRRERSKRIPKPQDLPQFPSPYPNTETSSHDDAIRHSCTHHCFRPFPCHSIVPFAQLFPKNLIQIPLTVGTTSRQGRRRTARLEQSGQNPRISSCEGTDNNVYLPTKALIRQADMKPEKPKLIDIFNELKSVELGGTAFLLTYARLLPKIRQWLPDHTETVETDDWFRTFRYLFLRFGHDRALAERMIDTFPIYAAYNLMRIESSEMVINGSQQDKIVKLTSYSIAATERAKSYYEQDIEPKSLNFEGIFQEALAKWGTNLVDRKKLSDRALFKILFDFKLAILESQYAVLMENHLKIRGGDEIRQLKELIHLYVKLIKDPRKQLDLFLAPFFEMSLVISKETANAYCIRALEIFIEKLHILQPDAQVPDLIEIRSKYLPSYKSCFISYTSEDQDVADFLARKLSERGIKCWLDKHEILAGDNINATIDRGIKEYDKIILCCSRAAFNSWWVGDELSKALQKEKSLYESGALANELIIPIDLDGYIFTWPGPNANRLKERHILDFKGWNHSYKTSSEKIEKLLQALLINKYYDNSNLPNESF